MNLYGIPPLLSLICFLCLAVLAWRQGSSHRQNRIFIVLCLLGTLLNADILLIFHIQSPLGALWVSRIDHLFVVYTIPLYIHFFHEYLGVRRRKWLLAVAYGYASMLMLLAPTPLCLASMQRYWFGYFARGGPAYPLVGGGALFAVGYSLLLIYREIRREKQRAVQRNRLMYMLVGFGGMGFLNGCNLLPLLGFPVYPAGTFSFIPLTLFAFGLFRYDLLDLNLLLRSSLVHVATACLLAVFYVGAFIFLGSGFPTPGGQYAPEFLVVFFFFVMASVRFLQSALRAFLEKHLETDANRVPEAIRSLGKGIASVLNLDDIARLLDTTVRANLHPVNFSVVLRNSDANGFSSYPPQFLKRLHGDKNTAVLSSRLGRHLHNDGKPLERRHLMGARAEGKGPLLLQDMNRMEAEVIFPLLFHNRLNGFISIGECSSGRLYNPEELVLMETLAGQAALAVENANAVQKIERMNAGLENAVRDRTRKLEAALEEKERAQAILIRSESLASIGQLVAGAAHELNNPLSSAISLLQSAMETVAPPEPAPRPVDPETIEDLAFVQKELQRARDIVSSLLDLSRQTQTYNEPVDLSRVTRHALRIVTTQFPESFVRVVEKYEENLPVFSGNFANIGQAVVNLIKNAFQALPETGGTVFLTTGWDAERSCVFLRCSDTGKGIPANITKDLFKPFFTTKPVGQGTGLGLYVSHEIVKKHDGQISVVSQPEAGTTFTMHIPLEAAAP